MKQEMKVIYFNVRRADIRRNGKYTDDIIFTLGLFFSFHQKVQTIDIKILRRFHSNHRNKLLTNSLTNTIALRFRNINSDINIICTNFC